MRTYELSAFRKMEGCFEADAVGHPNFIRIDSEGIITFTNLESPPPMVLNRREFYGFHVNKGEGKLYISFVAHDEYKYEKSCDYEVGTATESPESLDWFQKVNEWYKELRQAA